MGNFGKGNGRRRSPGPPRAAARSRARGRVRLVGWATWLAACAPGLAAGAGEVQVRVENPPPTGRVVALIYDDAAAFADLRAPLRMLAMSAAEAVFADLPAGRYAVLVFHDRNGNGALDRNFLGLPREPLGFSNRYWGKGAPIFSAAAVEVGSGTNAPVSVELRDVFGRRGLIGVGAGVITQSNPYRGADTARVQAIPVATYIGRRIQILGPLAQIGLADWRAVRLAATARYRLGAYDEDDSDDLEGMGDRRDSLFCGLALQGALPAGVRISAGYEHDALDRVGGGAGRLALRRGFPVGRFSAAPALALNWQSAELAGHEYGVEPDEARAGRPAYRPGDAVNIEPGLGLVAEWTGSWRLIVNGSVEFLANELRESPLVEKGWVVHGFAAVNYTF